MTGHARLGPSAAHRWMLCPGSVRLIESAPPSIQDATSVYAEEGSRAHTVAEILAARHFGIDDHGRHLKRMAKWRKSVPDEDTQAEMIEHGESYVQVLQSHSDEYPDTQVLLEQRVQTGVDGCWGTADAVLISPTHIQVVDYKYGKGVKVDAHDNPQLWLYGVGALEQFDLLGSTEGVCVAIYQPRVSADPSHQCLDAIELRKWRDQEVAPQAKLALGDYAYLAPSETACRWCPVAGACKARMEWETQRDFGNPDLMDGAQMSQVLPTLEDHELWCRQVREAAMAMVYDRGVRIPGWKVVRSASRREITDTEAAIELLVDAGLDRSDVMRVQTSTLTNLDKAAGGKAKLAKILGELMRLKPGKPSLVSEDDTRPAIDPNSEAIREFTEEA